MPPRTDPPKQWQPIRFPCTLYRGFAAAARPGTAAMMHQYTCPKCKTVLKREQPVAAGKKIKCPKCENIFAPPAPSAVTAKAGAKSKVEEDDRNPYAVKKDDEEDEKAQEEKQRAAMGLIQDRFEKSARGPAIAVIV